jgi:predicted DNA-binding transcriptional regulator AlpA
MKPYSTRQAAKQLGISLPTLNRYIGDEKIPVPVVTELAGMRVRVWSDADIEKVRKLLPKIANGRKTRYKKKKKTST